MSSNVQIFEFQLKKRSIFMLLIAGVCASAFAQAPALSLPSLPALPEVKYPEIATIPSLPPVNLPTASSALPPLPSISTAGAPLPSLGGLPSLPGVESPFGQSAPKPIQGSPTPLVLNGITEEPAPATNPENAAGLPATIPTIPDVQVDATATPGAMPVGGMPALPLPGEQMTDAALPTPAAAMPIFDFSQGSVSEEAPAKTWGTTLAPSITLKETDFNYKRHLLSETIYRTQYDKYNRHLPRRVTRDEYANLLFNSVAKNDLNTTRALLNAGVSLSATNPYGETPLMLAQRLGATQVAELLLARGAKD